MHPITVSVDRSAQVSCGACANVIVFSFVCTVKAQTACVILQAWRKKRVAVGVDVGRGPVVSRPVHGTQEYIAAARDAVHKELVPLFQVDARGDVGEDARVEDCPG